MPTNADLLSRRHDAVARGLGHVTPISASRALNAEIWDVEGKRYIDFAAGVAVLNTGHCHPKILAAATEQMYRFTHTSFQVVMYEPYIALAERLNALVPIQGPLKTVFFTTGAEATENAVKIARAATGRSGVIAFSGGFHGRTIMASAMTGRVVPYKKDLGPTLPEVWHVPFPMPHLGVSVDDALKYLDHIFRADVDPSRIAAIIIEPVQGEAGVHPASPELMRTLRRLCDESGIVLVADEVQTGFGRTGKMFAMEHYDVTPDLICVGKSLAGGFPLSGVVGRAAIMDAADPGALGGTYAGNPFACAAALAVLDVIAEEKLLDRADAQGEQLQARLEKLRTQNNVLPIDGIRGIGAMVGFDIVKERGGSEPDPAATRRVVRAAYENGLVLLSGGVNGNAIRILTPLTAEETVIGEGLDILEAALAC